jgi:hypothetical protein
MSIVHDQRRTTGNLPESFVKKLLELGNLLTELLPYLWQLTEYR